MAGEVAVWDVIDLQYLVQRHLVSNELLAKHVMMVEASMSSLHSSVEIFLSTSTRACVLSLLKVVAQISSLERKSRAAQLSVRIVVIFVEGNLAHMPPITSRRLCLDSVYFLIV